MLDIAGGLVLKDKQEKFSEDLKFLTLTKKGVKLTIDFGKKVALKQGVKEISGAYTMRIDKKGVTIVGYDERGAFYGIQTLRQLIESPIAAEKTITLFGYQRLSRLTQPWCSRRFLRHTMVTSGTYVIN